MGFKASVLNGQPHVPFELGFPFTGVFISMATAAFLNSFQFIMCTGLCCWVLNPNTLAKARVQEGRLSIMRGRQVGSVVNCTGGGRRGSRAQERDGNHVPRLTMDGEMGG